MSGLGQRNLSDSLDARLLSSSHVVCFLTQLAVMPDISHATKGFTLSYMHLQANKDPCKLCSCSAALTIFEASLHNLFLALLSSAMLAEQCLCGRCSVVQFKGWTALLCLQMFLTPQSGCNVKKRSTLLLNGGYHGEG